MAIIQSGADSTVLTIDTASQAARVSIYDAYGNSISLPADHTISTSPSSVRLSDGTNFYKSTTPADTQPISAVSLPLPTNAAQEHVAANSPNSVRLTDGTSFYKSTTPSDTQPISAVSLPLPSGASQDHITSTNYNSARLTDGTNFYKPTTPSDIQPTSVTSGGNSLAIDSSSLAARVTQYKTDGTLFFQEYSGSYSAFIQIIPSTLTAGTTYWAMRNLGTQTVFIRRIELKMGFAGTVAASRSVYEIERFNTATPSGGTAITITKMNNNYPTSSVLDIRFAPGGLTTTGVVFESPFHQVAHTNQLNVDTAQDLDFVGNGEHAEFVLAVNEGLAIRSTTAIVSGSYLVGSIFWDERT